MRTLIFLLAGIIALNFAVDWQSMMLGMKGYEDHFIAMVLAAIVSPFLAPLFE